jgi:hypothetical protein
MDRSPFEPSNVLNKVISSVVIDDNPPTLTLVFDDGKALKLVDRGQSCCEHRYMQTDDDLAWFAGAKLLGVELRDASAGKDDEGDVHEIQFLHIVTSKGVLNVASHNEHNGYYGGFAIEAEFVAP